MRPDLLSKEELRRRPSRGHESLVRGHAAFTWVPCWKVGPVSVPDVPERCASRHDHNPFPGPATSSQDYLVRSGSIGRPTAPFTPHNPH